MADLLTSVSTLEMMTSCSNLTPDKASTIYNSKKLIEENWINADEWTQGTSLKFSMRIDESELANRSRPHSYTVGEYSYFARFISASESMDTSFPFNPPSIVNNIMSKEFEVEADRIAGYFQGTGTLYGQDYSDSDSKYKIGVNCRGTWPRICKILNGSISDITNATINSQNSLLTSVKKIFYSNANYDHLVISGVEYNGYYKRFGSQTTYTYFSDMFDGAFYALHSNVAPLAKSHIEFNANCLMFENQQDCYYYLQTGDSSKAIKPKEIVEDNSNWYIHSKIYSCDDIIETNKTFIEQNDATFEFDKNVSGTGGTRPIAGYILKTPTSKYNIIFLMNSRSTFVKGTEDDVKMSSFEAYTQPKYTWSAPFEFNNDYYVGSNNTNIPIFANANMCQAYFDGLIGINQALNKGGSYGGKPVNFGTQKTGSTLGVGVVGNAFSKLYKCSGEGMRDIAGVLYNETTMEDVLEGLKLNGEMPLSFIIDSFYVPFDVSPWSEAVTTSTMYFGTYLVEHLQGVAECVALYNAVDVFTVDVSGFFNDWRDYLTRMYLYLPFIGIFELDLEQWLYHSLNVKCAFDVMTGALKYYLLCDGIVTDTREGSVRVSMPMIGTDNYTASMSKITGATDIGTNAINTMIKPSFSSLLNFGKTALTDTMEINKATPKQIKGNMSSALAVVDELQCYIIIEQPQVEYADDMISMYGLPTNDVATIGSFSGYLQCDTILLKTTATETEQNEIQSLCSSGIII